MKLRKKFFTALILSALSLSVISVMPSAQANTPSVCQDYKTVKPNPTRGGAKSGDLGSSFGSAAGKVYFGCNGDNSNDLFSVIFRWAKGLFGG